MQNITRKISRTQQHTSTVQAVQLTQPLYTVHCLVYV